MNYYSDNTPWGYIKLKKERDQEFKKAKKLAQKQVIKDFKDDKYDSVILNFRKEIKQLIDNSKHLLNLNLIPKNEMGVVALFSHYFGVLGFEKITCIQTQFPDCLAIRNNKEVRIEFELYSSRFDHDIRGCDVVVCWKKDKELPGKIEIIELKHKLQPFLLSLKEKTKKEK